MNGEYLSQTKEYRAARYAANPEKTKASNREWYHKNKARVLARNAGWRADNPDRIKARTAKYRSTRRALLVARSKDYARKNPGKINALVALRDAQKLQATPAWADIQAIKLFYLEAKHKRTTVDHIVPLRGKTVCGLHWEGNLQLLAGAANASKGNRRWPDMWQ